jgi:riboflavin-specific deaminase-like protein
MSKPRFEIAQRPELVTGPVDEDEAWGFVRSLVRGTPAATSSSITVRGERSEISWEARGGATPEAALVLDLCLPLCVGHDKGELVVAHLGQSLDGRVAVPPGCPRLITGPEDLRHTHRLRALCDAVIVGATTVAVDDPQLTTRFVPGDLPVRVVLDPRVRLSRERRVFADGQAPSLVVVGRGHGRRADYGPGVDVVEVSMVDGALPVGEVLRSLRERGLRRLFVEGGGVTVSRFLDARALDRLHVAVASRIVGTGAPAIQLSGGALGGVMTRARSYMLGTDVLFDCDLRASDSRGRGLA